MTTAQIYSNNNQFQRCVQGLHEVARHVASWLRACGLAGVPVSFLVGVLCRRTCSRRRVLQPSRRLSYGADGIWLPGPVGCRCLLGPGLQGVNGRFPGWESGQTVKILRPQHSEPSGLYIGEKGQMYTNW